MAIVFPMVDVVGEVLRYKAADRVDIYDAFRLEPLRGTLTRFAIYPTGIMVSA